MQTEHRMRVFAGPNGSGKSTTYDILKSNFDCGYFINPDLMLTDLEKTHKLEGDNYNIVFTNDSFSSYANNEIELINKAKQKGFDFNIKVDEKLNQIICDNPNTYETSLISAYLRDKIIESKQSFTAETVFSHPSKIDQIKKGIENGYKTYLYFVCLESPELNKARVKDRVVLGGHDVPPDLIEQRYYKTLGLVKEVSELVDKAFFIDNSNDYPTLFAIMEKGVVVKQTASVLPNWFIENVINVKNNQLKY
jgi:predicted ABC-type ATPase